MVEKETNYKLDLKEVEALIKLCEGQRDLAYHLQKYKEAVEQRVKEMEIIKAKAQKLVYLKSMFKQTQRKLWLTLTEDEIKSINAMLQQRHIRI